MTQIAMKLGKEGWVLRSRAARGIQPLRPAQTPRMAERNLGTRSTKIESVSVRIVTFTKALIKLGSQLRQHLIGCKQRAPLRHWRDPITRDSVRKFDYAR
jgi:hypothetical protein